MENQKSNSPANGRYKFNCVCCGEDKNNVEFLINRSFAYRSRVRLTTCNDCIQELYTRILAKLGDSEDDVKTALYQVCRQFDYVYSRVSLEGVMKRAEEEGLDFVMTYLKQIATFNQYKNSRFADSDSPPQSKSNNNSSGNNSDGLLDVTDEMMLRWGKGLSDEDYAFLEDFFQQMIDSYGCEDPIKENILKGISRVQLKADKALDDDNVGDYDKLSKAMSKMMNDGGITPANRKSDNKEKDMVGTWIRSFEEYEPILDPLGIFADVDKIGHYINVFFKQHFSRIFGLTNDNDADYNMDDEKSVKSD